MTPIPGSIGCPCHGDRRLGDRRLFDGETGRPVNIGPTYRGPGEFRTIPEALAYFKRVDAAMERFYA